MLKIVANDIRHKATGNSGRNGDGPIRLFGFMGDFGGSACAVRHTEAATDVELAADKLCKPWTFMPPTPKWDCGDFIWDVDDSFVTVIFVSIFLF